MEGMHAKFAEAKRVLMEANSICIISHRSPDGDAVGSNLALRYCLESHGKRVVSACVDAVPDNSLWLRDADKFVSDFNYDDFDVIVSVDCGSKKLVAFHEKKPELFGGAGDGSARADIEIETTAVGSGGTAGDAAVKPRKPFINIDHHSSNDNYGTINLVDPSAAATAFIIFFFLRTAKCEITPDIATALMHGLYFDTGSFMHSNTNEYVLKVAGELMRAGASFKRSARELFHTTPVNKLRLWGRILERTYVNEEGVTVSAVGKHDYDVCGAGAGDTGGVIDLLNAVPGSRYCVLLSEDEKGQVKGSLRTQRDDVNLSEIAKTFGGGGHPKASGFGVSGRLEPVVSWKVVPENGAEAHGGIVKF